MAKDDKEKTSQVRIPSRIRDLASTLIKNMDSLYQKTYYTSADTKNDLETIRLGINKSIDDILAKNMNSHGSSNISTLYLRKFGSEDEKSRKNSKKLNELFEDKKIVDNLMSVYNENSYLFDYYNEIDTVLKYMPRLKEALDVRKDNVLSADHFNKNFLTVGEESNIQNDAKFNERCKTIIEKYKLLERTEEWYDTAAKYGEALVYCVPYKKAIAKLLAMKSNTYTPYDSTGMVSSSGHNESTMAVLPDSNMLNESFEGDLGSILESSSIDINRSMLTESLKNDLFKDSTEKSYHIDIEFNKSNVLMDVVQIHEALRKKKHITATSLNEANSNDIKRLRIDRGAMPKELDTKGFSTTRTKELKGSESIITADGEVETPKNEEELRIPGSVVRNLKATNIIPLYVEDLCMGFYYIEFEDRNLYRLKTKLADPVLTLKSDTRLYNQAEIETQDSLLRYISAKLSKEMDAKFVNLNQDLSEEIYAILKHNQTYNTASPDRMRITFIPPEDIEHIFFKMNDRTHRGVSDLEMSLLPAKLYAGLYISTTIASMTRAQDHRVYYVKQSIDSNISGVMMNVVNQIKKSNFNIRQIENINQVLNIIGKFNDYIIPRGPNGDAPIDFEVMQGQDVNPQTELMQKLEEMAINPTDVPIELIQARQSVDYALTYTMSNSKFLRKVYHRQAQFQIPLSNIFTKLFNAEYNETAKIYIKLPPPMFLSITNTDQLSNNINNLSQTITDIYFPVDNNDPYSDAKRNDMFNYTRKDFLKSFVNFDLYDKFASKVEQDISVMKSRDGAGQQAQQQ